MKVPQTIIGADLSKRTIDLYLLPGKAHLKISNTTAGFNAMSRWLKQGKVDTGSTLIVMEHTGLYSYRLEMFLHIHHLPFTKVSSLAIKRSMGIVRGKSDKIDALRIARYGYEKRDALAPATMADQDLERLALLHTTRQRLVRHRSALLCGVKLYDGILKGTDVIIKGQMALVAHFSKEIKNLEAQIRAVLEQNAGLGENEKLLQTIPGVGPVLSTATIVKTGNFTLFACPRKFCCFCGTAPFEHTSGTSIRKPSRVSHLADKGMKTLLDQAAKSAIQHDAILKQYYERRLQMGKSKMSTINIVRNKIIYRMFAVIKRQSPFVKDYIPAA